VAGAAASQLSALLYRAERLADWDVDVAGVAVSWLVYRLTGSALLLGVVGLARSCRRWGGDASAYVATEIPGEVEEGE
jgi:hypothetical protein